MTALTDSPSDIVRKMLVDLGVSSEPTFDPGPPVRYTGGPWPAFSGAEPQMPDNCITAYWTTDQDDGGDMHGNLYFHYGVQLRFRGDARDALKAKAHAVQLAVFQVACVNRHVTVTASGKSYTVVAAIPGPILDLGMNAPNDKRFLMTCNLRVPIRAL